MTENDFILLLKLYSHRHLYEDELMDQLDLTKSQLIYRIQKLNDYLVTQQLPEIERETKQLNFPQKLTHYIENLDFTNLPVSYLDQKSRGVLIVLVITTFDGMVSLNMLAQVAAVSKNTILTDLKQLKLDLDDFQVEINYSRHDGYLLLGEELKIRRFVEYCIGTLTNPHIITQKLADMEPRMAILADTYQNLIFHIESELEIQYSDRTVEISPLYFYFLDCRLAQEQTIMTLEMTDYHDLRQSSEYQVLQRIVGLYFQSAVGEIETSFLSLYFLSASKTKRHQKIKTMAKNQLREAILEFLHLFEQKLTIPLLDKESLVEKLVMHLSAAFYRYRYDISSPYNIIVDGAMKKGLEVIDIFVRQSIPPVEKVMELILPDKEIFFIASYIGGHIQVSMSTDYKMDNHPNALVLCENGLVYSNILMNHLKQIFPEIYFSGVMSIRDFKQQESQLKQVDLVFSSQYITTHHDLVVVQPFVSEFKIQPLIKEVNQILRNQGYFTSNTINEVMALIPNKVQTDVRLEIRRNLEVYFQPKIKMNTNSRSPNLLTKFQAQSLLVQEDQSSWLEILGKLGNELVDHQKMKPQDIVKIQQLYPEPSAEITFGGTILVPHIQISGLKDCVLQPLFLQEPLHVESFQVQLVVMLLAGNNQSHVTAVYELQQLSLSSALHEILELGETQIMIEALQQELQNLKREEHHV